MSEKKNNLQDLINEFWEYDSKTQIEFKNYIFDLFSVCALKSEIGDIIEGVKNE